MGTPYVEVRSALWQKIFASAVAAILMGFGLAPWFPSAQSILCNAKPHELPIVAAGSIFLTAGGLLLWWPVIKYSIHADEIGITQTNGLFSQSVQWSEVACYYMQANERFYAEARHHIEPVKLDADGKIIFQSFSHLVASSKNIFKQRKQLWEFVELQLAGKRIEAPQRVSTSVELAWKSLDFNWKTKSWPWRLARIFALVLYGVFWSCLTFLPIALAITNPKAASPWRPLLLPAFMICMFGPLIPHYIWVCLKARKIRQKEKTNSQKYP
jgi:hypothetical protein